MPVVAVVQLLVYAALQVPVGLLFDHHGPRRLIAAIMAFCQVTLALSPGVTVALASRVLVGMGDALTFISVLQLVAVWLPARRVALMTQATGLVASSARFPSSVPLVALLQGPGWATAFLAAAAMSAFAAVLVILVVRDAPAGRVARNAGQTWRELAIGFATVWLTQELGLGCRRTTRPRSGVVFALFWGFPTWCRGRPCPRERPVPCSRCA
jgi:MFS family permease